MNDDMTTPTSRQEPSAHADQEPYLLEDVMLNDYYVRQSVTAPVPDKELKAFKLRHHIGKTEKEENRLRPLYIALMSAAAVAAFFLLFYPHPFTDGSHSRTTSCNAASPVVAYKAQPTGQLTEVTISDDNGATHTAGSHKLSYQHMAEGLPQTARNVIHKLATPYGQTAEVELSDGTTVWLNANSQLTFPDRFTQDERHVSVKGEAYFKVAHDAAHPFIVTTGQINTKVIGTEFDVNTTRTEGQSVTLVKGSVEVSAIGTQLRRKLMPGENATISPDHTIRVKGVDVNAVCAWKDGNFYFENATLWDIAQELGQWYNVSVVFDNPALISTRIFLSADRHASLSETLTVINSMNKAKMTLRNGQIVIK